MASVDGKDAGVRDVHRAVECRDQLERPQSDETMVTYDFSGEEDPAKKEQ